jgi:hypothetical protein
MTRTSMMSMRIRGRLFLAKPQDPHHDDAEHEKQQDGDQLLWSHGGERKGLGLSASAPEFDVAKEPSASDEPRPPVRGHAKRVGQTQMWGTPAQSRLGSADGAVMLRG